MSFNIEKIQKILNRVEEKQKNIFSNLLREDTEEIIQRRESYKNNFRKFAVDFARNAGFSGKLIPDAAFEGMIKYCEAILNFEMETAITMLPPREMKTTIMSILIQAYAWTQDPTLRFMTASYSMGNSIRDNLLFQHVIMSKEYQELWGKTFSIVIKNKFETSNNRGGNRIVVSLLGQALGKGADIIILDDPTNSQDVKSLVKMEKTNATFGDTFIHRRNNPERSVISVIMQRLAHNDYVGAILEKKDSEMTVLSVPMLYSPENHCKIISPKTGKVIWEDPRTVRDQILAPQRYSEKTLMKLKYRMGTNRFNAVFQCDPTSDEIAIFKNEWFQHWDKPNLPEFEYTILSFDTAYGSDPNSSHSAATCFGLFYDEKERANLMLLSVFTAQLEWYELRKMAFRLARNFRDTEVNDPLDYENSPSFVVIEKHATGGSLIQELTRRGVPVESFRPRKTASHGGRDEAKTIRARMIQPLVENKRIWVRVNPNTKQIDKYGRKFLEACRIFPVDKDGARDIIDCFTQTVEFLKRNQLVEERSEDEIHYDNFVEAQNRYFPEQFNWNGNENDNFRKFIP